MPLSLPLEILGDLQAEAGDGKVRITAQGDTVTIALSNLRVLRLAMRSVGPGKARRQALTSAQQAMEATSLTLRFQLAGGTIAVLGAAARPGWPSRVLGMAPVELKLSGLWFLLRSLWHRG